MGLNNLNIKGIKVEQAALAGVKLKPLSEQAAAINFKDLPSKIDINNLKKDDVKGLLTKYGQDCSSEAIENIGSFEINNEENTLTIHYKGDQSSKIIKEDLSYQLVRHSTDGATGLQEEIASFYTANNELVKEKRTTSNIISEIFYDNEGLKTQTVEFNKLDNSTTTIDFDDNERPAYKTVKCGSTMTKFDYKGSNNSERILEKTENRGLPIESKETYTYREDGNVEIRTYSYNSSTASEQDAATNESAATDTHKGNTPSCTVKYCTASNFDAATGTVKNTAELSDTPPAEATAAPQEQNSDANVSGNQASTTDDATPAVTTTNNNQSEITTKKPEGEVPATKPASVATDKETTPQNDITQTKPVDSATPAQTRSLASAATPEQTTTKKSVATHTNLANDINNEPTPLNTTQISVNIKNNDQLKTNIRDISEQLDNYIRKYASEHNIPIEKVRQMIGLPSDSESTYNTIVQKVLNETTEEIKQNYLNASHRLTRLLSDDISTENFVAVSKTLSQFMPQKSEFAAISAPKEINNIVEFSAKSGFNAGELNSIINNIKPGESAIVPLNQITNGQNMQKTFKIEISTEGNIFITEVEASEQRFISDVTSSGSVTETPSAVNHQEHAKVAAFKAELAQVLPASIRKQLSKCNTIDECQKFVAKYISQVAKLRQTNELQSAVYNQDYKYKFILVNGTLKKIPATQPTQYDDMFRHELNLTIQGNNDFVNELTSLFTTGTYKNKNGRIIKIKPQNLTIKIPQSTTSLSEEATQVQINFEEPVSAEMQRAISEITHKYKHSKSNISHSDIESDAQARNVYSELEVENKIKIQELLTSMGFPNVQTMAFIASLAYVSNDGIRKTSVNRNSNETALSPSETVNMKDEI